LVWANNRCFVPVLLVWINFDPISVKKPTNQISRENTNNNNKHDLNQIPKMSILVSRFVFEGNFVEKLFFFLFSLLLIYVELTQLRQNGTRKKMINWFASISQLHFIISNFILKRFVTLRMFCFIDEKRIFAHFCCGQSALINFCGEVKFLQKLCWLSNSFERHLKCKHWNNETNS
jgi:hypothetical protein